MTNRLRSREMNAYHYDQLLPQITIISIDFIGFRSIFWDFMSFSCGREYCMDNLILYWFSWSFLICVSIFSKVIKTWFIIFRYFLYKILIRGLILDWIHHWCFVKFLFFVKNIATIQSLKISIFEQINKISCFKSVHTCAFHTFV